MCKVYRLNNGVVIPSMGYGTAIVNTYMYGSYSKKTIIKYWIRNCIKDKSQLKKDIGLKKILKIKPVIRPLLIDTSRAYAGSEKMIGDAMKKGRREDYFITTKIHNRGQINKKVMEGFEESLRNLGTEYVDLYLMHWPVTEHFIETWKTMEEIYKSGRAKAIGVCNCNISHLEEIRKNAEIMPMVNQFEIHPLFTQKELVEYCKLNNIQVMAYTPTGRMDGRLNNTIIPNLAQKYGKSNAQIIIRWHIQNEIIPIVNTSKPMHFEDNFNVWDFNMTEEEIKEIDKANINSRLRYDPDNCDFTRL